MKPSMLFLSDLDHTLFQSHRADKTGVNQMTVDRSGITHGYARQDQQDILRMMIMSGYVIPVTARSHDQMERVVGWNTDRAYELALVDLGATLLTRTTLGEWKTVEAWEAPYVKKARELIPVLESHLQMIRDLYIPRLNLEGEINVKQVSLGRHDIPFYLEIGTKTKELMDLVVDQIVRPILTISPAYRIHKTDKSVCMWPTYVSKGIAVQRLLDMINHGSECDEINRVVEAYSLKGSTVVTVGDNITDIEFMQHGNFMMAPRKSDIAELTIAALDIE